VVRQHLADQEHPAAVPGDGLPDQHSDAPSAYISAVSMTVIVTLLTATRQPEISQAAVLAELLRAGSDAEHPQPSDR
jgi:hypothetical protein